MNKTINFLFIFFLIISVCKCEEEEYEELEEEEMMDDLYDSYDDVADFKKSLKEYLVKNDLFNSDKLIERKEMEKIFLDVILNRGLEGIPDYLKGIIDYLTKYFLDKYYKKKKEIKGKDIYELIDILAISRKFEQVTGSSDYDDYEEEDYNGESITPESNL